MLSYVKLRDFLRRLISFRHREPSRSDLDKKLVFGLLKSRVPRPKQIKYLSRFLSHRELWIFRAALLILLVGLVWWGAHFYLYSLKQYPQAGGVYTEGLVGQPRLINPVFASLNETDYNISRLFFRGLLRYGADQQLQPDLAESYEISSDGKTYTLYLRRGIVWQDGEKFDADDVLFTVAAIKNPSLQSPEFNNFYGVNLEVIDPYTIKFTLSAPFAPFLSGLTGGILPEHIWNQVSDNQFALAERNLKPIGNGPFKFKTLTKDKAGFIKSYTLERNPLYNGTAAYLDGISFKFFTSSEEAGAALKSHNIDGLFYTASGWRDTIGTPRSFNRQNIFLPQYTALFFNQSKNTTLASANLRQALVLSTDRQQIINAALEGDGTLIQGPIAPDQLGYNDQIPAYDYDLEKAATLLDNLGWKLNPEDQLRYKSGQALSFTITTVNKAEYFKSAEIIKNNWARLGIQANVQTLPKENFSRDILRSHDYEILLYSVITKFDPDPYPIWHSSQIDNGLNLALYRSIKADRLLIEARSTLNTDERAAKYQEFQTILRNDLPAIFLYSPTHVYFLDKRLRGFDMFHLSVPADRFNDVELWHLKVKRRLQ